MRKLVITALLTGIVSGAFAQSVTTKIKKPSAWQKIKENTSMNFWSQMSAGNLSSAGNQYSSPDGGDKNGKIGKAYMSWWVTANLDYKLSNTSKFRLNTTFKASSDPEDNLDVDQFRVAYQKKFKITDKLSVSSTPRLSFAISEAASNTTVKATGDRKYGELEYVDAPTSISYKVTSNFSASVFLIPRVYNLRIGAGDRYRIMSYTTLSYSFNDSFSVYSEFYWGGKNGRADVITHLEERDGRSGEELVLAASIALGGFNVEPFIGIPTNSGQTSENTNIGFRLIGKLF